MLITEKPHFGPTVVAFGPKSSKQCFSPKKYLSQFKVSMPLQLHTKNQKNQNIFFKSLSFFFEQGDPWHSGNYIECAFTPKYIWDMINHTVKTHQLLTWMPLWLPTKNLIIPKTGSWEKLGTNKQIHRSYFIGSSLCGFINKYIMHCCLLWRKI